MKTKSEKVRINVIMSPELKLWLQEKSDEIGSNMSSYIVMMLSEKRNQEKALGQVPEMMLQMQNLQKMMNEKGIE